MVELETSRRSDCHSDAAVDPDLTSAAEHYRSPSKGPPRTIRSAPSTVSVRTMTSSPRPRPAGCRSVGNAVTRVARSRRLHLVPGDHLVGFVDGPPRSAGCVEGYAVVAAPVLELLVVREYGCDRPGAVELDRGVEMDSVEGPHLNRLES